MNQPRRRDLAAVPDPDADESARGQPAPRFRQTRHQNELRQLGIVYQEKKFPILNWSRTGVAFEVPADDQEFTQGKVIPDLCLYFEETILLKTSVNVRHRTRISENLAHVGASFVDAHLPVEAVESTKILSSIKKPTQNIFTLSEKLSPEFCQSIVSFIQLLELFKSKCETEETRIKLLPLDARKEAEGFFLPRLAALALEAFSRVNQKIAQQIEIEKLPENSPYHEVFDQLIFPYFSDSPVFVRSREKPRGYAGDYEMMNQVYRKGFEGSTLLARMLHHYGTIEGCGEAVRLRRTYLLNHCQNILKNHGPKNILSVAAGPAVECQDLIRKTSQIDLDRLTITLLDLDLEALEHAETKIQEILSTEQKRANVFYVNDSVKNIILRRAQLSCDSYDLIYSAGLFDYLDDRTAKVLVKKLFNLVSPGGLLAIGNFTKHNSSKAFLHLLCRWSLVHRSENDLLHLAEGINAESVSVRLDETKNIAFLVLTKVVE